ncbi:hypothetical protein [Flavobacterium sp. 123]|uniref:hypothetical protein n=1 Tax=Flavobacterium sp. 123 TaxID=2135627 RepID=UPI000EABF05E|nr:hypothetical protein [Flavobacterium sp. 123]RKT00460.1 hypothetical protein C8C88_2287 [Flavobacterium sp. 123]
MKNRTKIFYISSFLFLGMQMQAQVKVGDNLTAINPNAALEIESTTKGLIMPRIALTATTDFAPMSAHIQGMSVYNTATAGDVTPGYYYNDGTKWVRLIDIIAKEPWQVESTTNQATTNTQNIYQMGNIGIKTNAPNSALTVNGSANNLLAYDAGTDTTIDYSKSNLAYTTASAGNIFDLQNIKDGGTYTLAVQGSVSGTANFTSAGFTVHLPVDNGPSVVTGGKHSIYTILVLGTHVYMSWITGL